MSSGSDSITPSTSARPAPDEALVTYTHIVYALHGLAVLTGLLTAATVIGSFICGLPSLVAVIMNYARRSAVAGTFLESHFRWQIRTFWFALLWALLIPTLTVPLMSVLVGFPLFFAGLAALAAWIIYRVARGWVALRDGRPMYAP